MNNIFFFVFATLMLASHRSDALIHFKNQKENIAETTLFSIKKPRFPEIYVRPIELQSTQDILELADMRYHEWVQCDETDHKTPSLGAFRMATAEIAKERAQEGAVMYLARMQSNTEQGVQTTIIVGSAELSPIELQGLMPGSHQISNRKWLYVTDVVTSTNHRRLGVGAALMDAMESAAMLKFNATRIYLHVRPDNIGAMEFYLKRGYQKTPRHQENVNSTKLAEAAGAIGQTLLQKELVADSNFNDKQQDNRKLIKSLAIVGNKGFGKRKETKV